MGLEPCVTISKHIYTLTWETPSDPSMGVGMWLCVEWKQCTYRMELQNPAFEAGEVNLRSRNSELEYYLLYSWLCFITIFITAAVPAKASLPQPPPWQSTSYLLLFMPFEVFSSFTSSRRACLPWRKSQTDCHASFLIPCHYSFNCSSRQIGF